MKVCPIAIAVGCAKCPVVKVCPLKGVLGDAPPRAAEPPNEKPVAAPKAGSGKSKAGSRPAARTAAKSPTRSGKSAKSASSRPA